MEVKPPPPPMDTAGADRSWGFMLSGVGDACIRAGGGVRGKVVSPR